MAQEESTSATHAPDFPPDLEWINANSQTDVPLPVTLSQSKGERAS